MATLMLHIKQPERISLALNQSVLSWHSLYISLATVIYYIRPPPLAVTTALLRQNSYFSFNGFINVTVGINPQR